MEDSFWAMNELDDVIGLLNSGEKPQTSATSQLAVSQQETETDSKTDEQRLQNIEQMMAELQLLQKKKQELMDRNSRLKENQERPTREYSTDKQILLHKTSSEKVQ